MHYNDNDDDRPRNECNVDIGDGNGTERVGNIASFSFMKANGIKINEQPHTNPYGLKRNQMMDTHGY